MVLLEKFGDNEEHCQEETEFVLVVLLVDKPSVGKSEMFQSDGPHADGFQVDDVLSDLVVSPVGDREH